MCLAIPAQITELKDDGMARARVGESHTYLNASVALLPEPAQVGDYVIIHAGFALHRLDPAEARETLKLLREMAENLEDGPAGF